jgi:hypothetical protein
MAIGTLVLDQEYVNYLHPERRWRDEPENSVLVFHFDPAEVKFDMKTGWKKGDPTTVSDFRIPWDWEGKGSPSMLRLKLLFTDQVLGTMHLRNKSTLDDLSNRWVREAHRTSCQRSLEILEALALPILDEKIQYIGGTYERVKEFQRPSPVPVFVTQRNSWERWELKYERHILRPENPYTFEQTEVGGRRLVKAWHPPRPLLLKLVTEDEWKCVIQDLDIEIITMDDETGNPTVAEATVNLAEFDSSFAESGYDGMLIPESKNIEEELSLDKWKKQVNSGEVKELIEPKITTTRNRQKALKKPEEK